MNKKTISLCMIVKDEEVFLGRCLDSVKNQVDEIIIVDTGSTDASVNIAKEYGAKIYTHKWNHDFAEARNFSIEQASSEYILILDADEFLDISFNIQESLNTNKDYYVLTIKNHMSNGYISYHQAIRLFRKTDGLHYYGKIHEHLNIEQFNNLSHEFSDIVIEHDGYKQEIYKEKNKENRNLKILLKEVNESPTGYNLFNLGVQYKVSGNFENAINMFKKSYFLSKDKVYLPYLLYLMGDCLLSTQKYEEGINLMKDAIQLYPTYTGYHFVLGNLYGESGYLLDSEFSYKKALELGEVKGFQTIDGVGSYLSNIKLSEVLQKQGKLVDALNYAFNAIQQKKDFAPAISQYINVLIQSGIEKSHSFNNIKQVYRITSLDEVILLSGVLLAKRSGILLEFINEYNLNVDKGLMMIANLYGNRYNEALDCWQEVLEISEEYLIDVINLAVVRNDENLINEVVSKLSLSDKDKKYLIEFIVNGKVPTQDLSEEFSSVIIKFITNFISMNEKEIFHLLASKLTKLEKIFLSIVRQSDLYGYSNYVLNCSLDFSPKYQEQFLEIISDIYLRNGNYKETIEIINNLYNRKPSYQNLNRFYNFYEKTKDQEGLNLVLNEISKYEISNIRNL
ncbi:glycosyltransferase family 2 protein [Robertmurraya yapensis]|uniref:Glycosyltransferase family 2 protein n=1 Tax=Bacillus yapensis TaxID=2492960 RepID=A0A431WM54_9BACI|nr:glycosyltransferase family 2 protein [Bacillus yapensis]RTR36369.1 glycosyltransferase family 2 protein [Bacillus yapensis]TKT05873.1 glycosyltransferase family 2 protein [Bacillus yapensis]